MQRYVTTSLEEEGAVTASTGTQTVSCGGVKELISGYVSYMCKLTLPNLLAEHISPKH